MYKLHLSKHQSEALMPNWLAVLHFDVKNNVKTKSRICGGVHGMVHSTVSVVDIRFHRMLAKDDINLLILILFTQRNITNQETNSCSLVAIYLHMELKVKYTVGWPSFESNIYSPTFVYMEV